MHHHKTWAYRRLDQALKNLDVILLDLKEEDVIPLPDAG